MTILHLTDLKMAVHFPSLSFLSFTAVSHKKYKYSQIISKNTPLQPQTVWVVQFLFEFRSLCVCVWERDYYVLVYTIFIFSSSKESDKFLLYRISWNDSRGITKLRTDNSGICNVEVLSADSWPLSIWQVLQLSPPINTPVHQTYCVCRKVKCSDVFSCLVTCLNMSTSGILIWHASRNRLNCSPMLSDSLLKAVWRSLTAALGGVCTHAHTHTHARTHIHTHAHTKSLGLTSFVLLYIQRTQQRLCQPSKNGQL